MQTQVFNEDLTDHYPILVKRDIINNRKYQTILSRPLGQLKTLHTNVHFLLNLQLLLLNFNLNTNPNKTVAVFLNIIKETADKHLPLKTRKITACNRHWINNSIKSELTKRSKLHKKLLKYPHENALKEKYINQKNKVKRIMRETKENYYIQKPESIRNGKKLFNVFKEFVSSKASSHYELTHSLLNQNYAQSRSFESDSIVEK